MNPTLTDRRLSSPGWRRRYRAARSTLLHFKLTLQTLALPDDPTPEKLSEVELERFVARLLADLSRFAEREARFLEALGVDLRPWRVAEILPLLELFDETAGLPQASLSPGVRNQWRGVAQAFVRLKARVVQLHVFG
jgi:hypothetical protein